MRIAISGHRGLPEATASLVDTAIRAELARHDDADELVGVSCLADGADQLFARAILDVGGTLEVIVPAEQYRAELPTAAHQAYDDLLTEATKVHRLLYRESTSEAHMHASMDMLANADTLIAVWDGKPARGYGGTADVVQDARNRGLPITIIWPSGATRD